VVDSHGAGLSMTTTVEDAFGSRQMVDGFILNNQLTDFSFDSKDASGPIANRVEAGKRPRSAMSPTIVFDKKTGKLVLAVGSPGGPADHQLRGESAGRHPRLGPERAAGDRAAEFRQPQRPDRAGSGALPAATVEQLKARGHTVRQANRIPACTASAHADPRRAAGGSAVPIRAAKVWQKATKSDHKT
jgi:gamma-glutamyltranspeptidase/glutathione hydrolase